MIVVTGTHRSGTSMWMQILRAAGLPLLGERFPASYAGLAPINPEGFWETRLRMGVNFTSNPDPETGIYLSPAATRDHVVKVFVRGLVRTDVAFLDRVVATLRPWREHTRSMERLLAAEEAPLQKRGTPEALERLRQRREAHGARPPAVEWFLQLHALLADVAIREYPHHLVPYTRLLRDPRSEIAAVLDFIGAGELQPAVAAVRPELHTQQAPEVEPPPGLTDEMVAVFDGVYDALDRGSEVPVELVRAMNEVRRQVAETFASPLTG